MRTLKLIVILFTSLILSACGKDFLNVKPDKALVVPQSLTDFQTLLDNASNTNGSGIFNSCSGLNTIADGDFTSSNTNMPVIEKNSYLWAEDIFVNAGTKDWNDPYQQVFYANVVLDGLGKLASVEVDQRMFDQLRGTALFYRSFAFFNLVLQFCAAYDNETSNTLPGIPILLTSDVNQKYTRGTLKQTVQQIIDDLNASVELLPAISTLKTRPDQLAVNALLSRVYLYTSDYVNAEKYSDAVLKINSNILDYNSLIINGTSATNPFPQAIPLNNNPEVLFYSAVLSYGYNSSTLTSVVSSIFNSYEAHDLRKLVYYNNRGNNVVNFKGHYTGDIKWFSGLAVDEIYLIKAECCARRGEKDGAMVILNSLLIKRFATNNFSPLVASDAKIALGLVLQERRKELLARGIRWGDLKRLNLEEKYAVTLYRTYNGQVYTLPPNDLRYALPIPNNEIVLGGIPQNER